MNEIYLKFIGDKLVPLVLVILGGVGYLLDLPHDYCAGIGAAGLLAFQISRAAPANPPENPKGTDP